MVSLRQATGTGGERVLLTYRDGVNSVMRLQVFICRIVVVLRVANDRINLKVWPEEEQSREEGLADQQRG